MRYERVEASGTTFQQRCGPLSLPSLFQGASSLSRNGCRIGRSTSQPDYQQSPCCSRCGAPTSVQTRPRRGRIALRRRCTRGLRKWISALKRWTHALRRFGDCMDSRLDKTGFDSRQLFELYGRHDEAIQTWKKRSQATPTFTLSLLPALSEAIRLGKEAHRSPISPHLL